MMLKVYRVRAIDNDLINHLMARARMTRWDIVAHDMASAWRKFVAQRFPGPIAPNPDHYDIRLDRMIDTTEEQLP